MIHIITYQSIRGNDVTKSFNDFALALNLITILETNGYPFLYNSMKPDLSHDTTSDTRNYRCDTKRHRAIEKLTERAFVSCNNQTKIVGNTHFPRLVDVARSPIDQVIKDLIFEKQIA